jgi:hypothetical protein
MSDQPKDFSTSDIGQAGFLYVSGYRLRDVSGPVHQVSFVFADVPASAVLAYFADATVPARKYLNALRDLKGLAKMRGERR